MIKNYWYIVAFSVVIAILTIQLDYIYLSIIFFLWLLFLVYQKKLSPTFLCICIVAFVFYYHYIPTVKEVESTIDPKMEQQTTFHGKVISSVKETDTKIEFSFKDSRSDTKILAVYYIDDAVSVPPNTYISSGSHCDISGSLFKPEPASNPHQFDYRTYLLQQGIVYQLYIDNISEVTCEPSYVFHLMNKIRLQLFQSTLEKLDDEVTAWLHALVLGDDSRIDEAVIDIFQRWSLSHILAISGLHVGIIVGLLYVALVRSTLWTKETSQWIIMFFLPIYAFIAGGQPSVLRASLMVLFALALSKLKWKLNYTDVISIVFLLLILFDPFIVYHIGFQLSFAVTFGLIVSQAWISQTTSNTMRILQISFISQMIILPLQLHYFYLFQPLSIIINLLIVPYFSLFVIPAMFGLLIFHWLPNFLTASFEKFFLLIHEHVLLFIQWIDQVFDYPFTIGEIPLYFTIIYYIFFILMMKSLENNQRKRAFQSGIAITTVLIVLTLRPYFSPVGSVTMLDIGQGDAFVLELPYRKGVFFIDIGTPLSFPDFEASNKAYEQVIKPYLYGQGISKIDTVFISHKHLDHYGSLPYALEDFSIDEIIVSPLFEIEEADEGLWENQSSIYRMKFNESIERKGQLFQALSPQKDYKDENENSLVLLTKIGGKNWLFTGDMYKQEERDILNAYSDMDVDVLKVGHHGSNTSTEPSFIELIKADYALISAGKNNMYGHPAEEVLQTLSDEKIKVYRTDEDGAVQFFFTERSGTFQSYRRE